MQAHQRVPLARHAEFLVELGQHLDRHAPAGLLGHHAVEQHDAPGADVGRSVEFEGSAAERGAHLRHQVVIPGDAQYGFAEAREHTTERFVATRVVLHQVAGDQDGVTDGQMPGGICQRALERFERIHATQRSCRIAKQMWVGELDDSDGTHSIALYKHAPGWRVIRVTTRFHRAVMG